MLVENIEQVQNENDNKQTTKAIKTTTVECNQPRPMSNPFHPTGSFLAPKLINLIDLALTMHFQHFSVAWTVLYVEQKM